MFKRFAFLALLSLCLAGLPAAARAQADPSLLALQAMDQRVAAIGHRLARANADICPRTMPLSGLLVHSLDQYSEAGRPVAARTFDMGAEPVLLVVVPGSAAERAGLRAGDKIVSIAGRAVPPAKLRKKGTYDRVRQIENDLIADLSAGPVPIEYLRGGVRGSALLKPDTGCLSRVQLRVSPQRNAKADGTYAQVTTGIVEFTRNDDELALVIAHEMAHNILAHRERLDAQKVSRGIFKAIDGSAGKIKVTEIEADYLALYLVARAGYDVGAAPGFWKRYGPGGFFELFSDGTHPGKGARMAAAERTIAEIRAKQQQGLPLVPEL